MSVRYRLVPEPRGLEFLRSVGEAVPSDPGTVDNCCRHVTEQTGVDEPGRAREWLGFLRALGLVEETDGEYYRTGRDSDQDGLATAYETRVYGTTEVLDELARAEEPLTAEAVTGRADLDRPPSRSRKEVDAGDRSRQSGFHRRQAYVERLLEWGVVFGLVEDVDGKYESARP